MLWVNLDYQVSGYLAVYGSITTLDGAAHELALFAEADGGTQPLVGPNAVAQDAFVLLELDFDPANGTVSVWADGASLPAATLARRNVENYDQFATILAPQGTGEFDELWIATCTP